MNKKLSSFESISASEINNNSVYVSAVQKLNDGSYKNINIPISQLSSLWNNDVKTAIANADFEGGAIDAEVIHQAALNAVENALRDAKQSITEAIERANTFIGEVSSGNTATQQAIAEANEKVLQEINAGLDRLGEINTLYGNYFGPGGVVEQALNDANNELAISKDLLRDAQAELEALANGEITSTGIKNLEEKVNGLVTLVGLEGDYVDPDGKFANRVYEALNLAMGNKTFMLKNINGEDQTVTTFDQLISAVNGIYTTTLSRVNALSGEVTNIRDEWDVEKGKMEESISKNNFSDPDNQTVKQAVRTMTADLIEQSVRKAVLDEIETITFLKTDPVGYVREITTPLAKETLYFLTWDKATDKDNPTQLEYQFVVLENGNEQPSLTAYKQLTTEGIRSSVILTSSQSQEQGGEPEEENYTRKLYIRLATALEDDCIVSIAKQKYFSQSQISQTVDGVIISAVKEELGKHNFSEVQVTDEYIKDVVAAYNNEHGIINTSQLNQTAQNINASVNTFKQEVNNNLDEKSNQISALQSNLDITDSKIDNTVSSYTCEIIDEWDESNHRKCIDDHQDESNNSIVYKSINAINGTESAPNNVRCLLGLHQKNEQDIYLEHGHEYFLKIENISKIHYIVVPVGNTIPTIGNVQTDILENSLFTHSTDNSNRITDLKNDSVLYFYYECKYNNKTHQRVGEPNIQLLESVSSKFANFEITADHIKEAISGQEETTSGNGVINLIYQRLATAGGSTELIGEVGPGFLNQNQVVATATSVARNLMGLNNGESGNGEVTFVQESTFKQAIDEIKSDVAKTQFTSINGVFKNESDSDYEQGPLYNGAYGVVGIEPLTQDYFMGRLKNPKIENYNDQNYTIIMDNFDIFSIAEVSINGTVWFTKIPNTISNLQLSEIDERRTLRPIHFDSNDEVKNLMLKYYRLDVQGKPLLQIGDITNNYMPKFKIGYPTDVAVSNIKQTADGIKLQVSEFQNNDYLTTSQFNIEKNNITSTVAAEVDGKLAGYSTIEQTKDFIASTVGKGGVVTNKFHDPLFKHQYGYWLRRWDNYPNYVDFTYVGNPASNVSYYTKKFSKPVFKEYVLRNATGVENRLEQDLKSFIMYDDNPPTNITSQNAAQPRRHIYGMYSRMNLIPGNKYTASFYIKLADINSNDSSTIYQSFSYKNLKLNTGFTAELAKLTPTFHIALVPVSRTLEQSENKIYDSAHDLNGEEINWDSYNVPFRDYRFEFNNQGNLTGNGFRTVNNQIVDDPDQFGLWINFGKGKLAKYLEKVFGSTYSMDGEGPDSGVSYRWFKIWFTFTAGDKYYDTGSSLSNCDENYDRAFCFEPWISWGSIAPNTYRFSKLFCEIATPMLNTGETPLKFSSQEPSNGEQYSTISQTQESIDMSIKSYSEELHEDLEQVGIHLDGNNSSITFNAENSTFMGAVKANSFEVAPSGSKANIKLIIYDPINKKREQAQIIDVVKDKYLKGTPLLVVTDEQENLYIVDLTKINTEEKATAYWRIYSEDPTGSQIIISTGSPNSSGIIYSLSSDIILRKFNTSQADVYKIKYIAEQEIKRTKIGTIRFNKIGPNNLNKYFKTYKPLGNDKIRIPFKGGGKDFQLNKYCLNLTDIIENEPLDSSYFDFEYANIDPINALHTPIFIEQYHSGISIYKHDMSQGANGYDKINGKTVCYARKLGETKLYRVYKDFSDGKFVDFRSGEKYCFTCGNKFIGFCGYMELVRRYNLYLNSNNYSSPDYAPSSLTERLKSIAEYFIKDSVFEAGLSNDLYKDGYESFDAYTPTNCRVFFNKSEINFVLELMQRGVLAGLSTDYFIKN